MVPLDDSALARRLIAAANDLLATAYQLGARHRLEAREDDGVLPIVREMRGDASTALELARQAYRDRRRRERLFAGADLFGEPAWDILLDLFIAAREGKRISITSACIGASAPPTTALRWLNILERHGLIEREGDTRDHRRSYVRLTAAGQERMIDYFSEAGEPISENEATLLPSGRRSRQARR